MLDQYLKTIAHKVKGGTKVYLCPAAMETVILAKMLKFRYGVIPSGFCDNDIKKQGNRLNSLPEMEIFSFDEVLKDGQAEFLVVSPHHSAAIMGSLMFERGVSEKQIINFQPMERRNTCSFYAHNWIIHEKHFTSCCAVGSKPEFDNQRPDPKAGITYLEKLRRELIDCTAPIPTSCHNCYQYKNYNIFQSRKLNSLNFSFQGWCNYKCDYCSAHQPSKKNYDDSFSLEEYLKELEKRDAVSDFFSVLFAVGEPTLNEKRFGLYAHCREKQYFLDVFSNCSVFDGALFDLAQESPVIIRKSFDAGTSETYAKIKGVDCWQKMLENLYHYLQAPFLVLNPKYLFMPGINDNETDVKNFVKVCVDFSVDFVTPVFSLLDNHYEHSAHAREMFKLLVGELAANNIFTANVDTLYSENYHNVYINSF